MNYFALVKPIRKRMRDAPGYAAYRRLEELCCRVERMWLEDKTRREHTAP